MTDFLFSKIQQCDIEEEHKVCPICLSDKIKKTLLIQKCPDIFWIRCLRCHAAFASRFPNVNFLDCYYSGQFACHPHSNDAFERIYSNRNNIRIANHIFSLLGYVKTDIPKKIRILDYGGADGQKSFILAKRMIQLGCEFVEITVLDFEVKKSKVTDDRIVVNFSDSIHDLKGEFDVILFSAVLEHVVAPVEILIETLRRVAVNGRVYIRTPWMLDFAEFLSAFGIKVDLLYPAHLYDLSGNFWKKIFQNNKLNELSDFYVLSSGVSLVETLFRERFFRTLAAYIFKLPYFLFKNYSLVGGWELVLVKNSQ